MRLADRLPALNYQLWQPAALLVNPEIDSLLVLGMGAGVSDRYLRRARPDLQVDYVDIDPAIPEIAERYFFFQPGPLIRAHVADGRRFLADSAKRWDYIYTDTYIGMAVPFHLTTAEFFDTVRSKLTPEGILGVNLAAEHGRAVRARDLPHRRRPLWRRSGLQRPRHRQHPGARHDASHR